jgi:hypothetical protein
MAAEWNEPAFTINGTPLTVAQAMTIRVAIGAFAMDLRSTGLGDDDHGAAMTKGYLAAIRHIVALMENT